MKLKIRRPYYINYYNPFSISYKNNFILVISNELDFFYSNYSGLTFEGNCRITVDEKEYTIHNFVSLIEISNIFLNDAWLDHFSYDKILENTNVLPFAAGLSWDYFYFIGAGNENLNFIYIYEKHLNTLTKITESIEKLFNEKINYDLY